MTKKSEKPMNYNLSILGLAAIIIAVATTSLSIIIYHNSGDIYLDRSRPGFLPDEKEAAEADNVKKENYTFSENADVNKNTMEEYLEHYQTELNNLDKIQEPFSKDALSDEALGLPKEELKDGEQS
ncbi:hypothetical protein IJH74_01625 [Candidatus Saccharibacteria bacterium]|nr:hypothetical protein [Candidatus Saccharibacteria bacterium]